MVIFQSSDRKKRAEKWGRMAEFYTLAYLTIKGYKRIGHRVRTPFGELDLIMKKRKNLVFVEVKARKNRENITDSLSRNQKNRIIKSASYWLSKRPVSKEYTCRFDVVFLSYGGWILHQKNAFQAESLFLASLL